MKQNQIDPWTARWDQRYEQTEYAYGTTPNLFFKDQLEKLPTGTLLLPAEGEGRNAVFAATKGWEVHAFDISSKGKIKAENLAAENKVKISYNVGDIASLPYKNGQFDCIGLIYAHFPAPIKSQMHNQLVNLLKTGAYIIFEAFSKKHLHLVLANEKIGGPRDEASLFSMEEIEADFAGFDIELLEEKEIELNEGLYHNGVGSVIRFIGRKR